jgi:AmmeMemoRadiSam system protein A
MPYPPVDELKHRPAREENLPEDAAPAAYSVEERRYLIDVARNAIAAALAQREYHPEPLTPNLSEPRGVFVTLMLQGQLRGCVGQIAAMNPLVEAVAQSAVSAAFSDPRFPPVTSAELPLLHIEISVLSPMQRIAPEEVRIGVHGLMVCCGARRGLLLPQVATEFGWGVGVFLEQTCRKAGLPGDAWQQPGTELYGFTAEKFGE